MTQNIVQDALDLFTEQFKGSTNVLNLANCLVTPYVELNQVQTQLRINLWLHDAVGQQLDGLGEILGLARAPGMGDDQYRDLLIFQTFINTSKGTPNDLLQIVAFLSKATFTRYFQHYNAGFQIFTNGPVLLNATQNIKDYFEFNDHSLFGFNDGNYFAVVPTLAGTGLSVGLIGTIAPAGVDYFSLSYSLGNTPLFGFGSEGASYLLQTDNTGLFETNENGNLQYLELYENITDLPSPDGFVGFSEVGATLALQVNEYQLIVSDGSGDFELTVSNDQMLVGGGKMVEGIRDAAPL